MVVCDWEKKLEVLHCKGYKGYCGFDLLILLWVEPKHGMYLNKFI